MTSTKAKSHGVWESLSDTCVLYGASVGLACVYVKEVAINEPMLD